MKQESIKSIINRLNQTYGVNLCCARYASFGFKGWVFRVGMPYDLLVELRDSDLPNIEVHESHGVIVRDTITLRSFLLEIESALMLDLSNLMRQDVGHLQETFSHFEAEYKRLGRIVVNLIKVYGAEALEAKLISYQPQFQWFIDNVGVEESSFTPGTYYAFDGTGYNGLKEVYQATVEKIQKLRDQFGDQTFASEAMQKAEVYATFS